MRKLSILLSILVLAAMVLTACGGEETTTEVPASPPPVTADATDEMATESPEATEPATEPVTTTETPGVPVTGDLDPARLSNQLDFIVLSQDGEQIGEVDDMVLDLENTQVAYVMVGTGGFLDLGEREILVPWNMLTVQTATGDATGGQQNAFVLQGNADLFRNAPDFDLGANLPEAGQPAGDWDVDIRTYWESGGAAGGTASTPAGDATAVPEMTATGTGPGTGTDLATATTDAGTGTGLATATLAADQGTGTDTGEAQDLQGVVLASEVLGSTITLSPGQGEGTGTGAVPGTDQGQATLDPNATALPEGTAMPEGTATPTTGQDAGTGADQGQGVGNIQGTVDDMIVDVATGEIQYIVVDVTLDEGERWIPVPLSSIQWDAANGAFVINANPATFREAPFFENGEYPDTSTPGWDSEFDTFWQNNGA